MGVSQDHGSQKKRRVILRLFVPELGACWCHTLMLSTALTGGILVFPMLQMRKLRHKKFKRHAQSHSGQLAGQVLKLCSVGRWGPWCSDVPLMGM